ncbi:MAG: penicillin acylase family protein [Alphaproteobacteria bacterium]|nr:penicillin acylase family protein [Alphaproteobacteria bacterium]
MNPRSSTITHKKPSIYYTQPSRFKKFIKYTSYTFLTLILLALILGTGFYFWLKTGLPKDNEEYNLTGLTEKVQITRDAEGIPYIKAKNLQDASFALGFLHAQDRLWQMDMVRRYTSGRLSEVYGERALENDKFMRVMGFNHLVQQDFELLSKELQNILEAYTKGVNAYIKDHKGALSPEFYALTYTPEEWKPQDSLLWQKSMALALSHNWRNDLLRSQMLHIMSEEELNKFWPNTPENGVVTLTKEELEASDLAQKLLTSIPNKLAPQIASNAWVIHGDRTESGKPILANDPHLQLITPGNWYLARIETPEHTFVGATAPSVPFVVLGRNANIAWGCTTTMGDVQDVFVEKIDPNNSDHYLAPEGSLPFVTRDEEIKIKGGQKIYLKVRQTRHGVVISDILKDAKTKNFKNEVLALAWPALEPGDKTSQGLYQLNLSRNWTDFKQAMSNIHSPQQNVHYADIDGNIGFYAPARIPIRKKGSGLVAVPGWSGDYDWNGFIPFDELPHTYNPKSNLVFNANNKIVDESYPHHIAYEYDIPGARASRLKTLFDEPQKHSVNTFKKIQLDTVSVLAQDFLPLLLEAEPKGPAEAQLHANIKSWDGSMSKKAFEPLFFEAWLKQLHEVTFKNRLGDLYDDYLWWRPESIIQVLSNGHHNCQTSSPENNVICKAKVTEAFDKAYIMLSDKFGKDHQKWRWGKAHKAGFQHSLFKHIPIINKITDHYISTPGHKYTINEAASVMLPMDSFIQEHGPGLRAIYDMSDLEQSQFMIAPGQSGNFLSPYYMNFLKLWAKGKYVEIPKNPKVEQKKLTLIPK